MTYDADFNQLAQSHKEHEHEMAMKKEQLKYYVVKNIYFKSQQQPNFLTWSEKEQIRHLNKTDGDEWTPERLSQSFPAVEEVIIKILKANWTPSSMKRIQKHDENVRNNWALFKSGEMKGLDPILGEHLKKFSNRNFNSTQNAYVQTNMNQMDFQFPEPKSKEFLQILTSCKKMNKSISDKKKPTIDNKQTPLISAKTSKPLIKLSEEHKNQAITFDELVKNSELSDNNDHDEMSFAVSISNDRDLEKSDNISNNTVTSPKQETEQLVNTEDSIEKDVVDLTPNTEIAQRIPKYSVIKRSAMNVDKNVLPPIQDKIKIPRRLRKRCGVYKLYDCFYDNRGYFLYRVPGLVN